MKFMTTLERDEDGVWVAECPSIPGCVSQGKSREEALDNIREAISARRSPPAWKSGLNEECP